MIEQACTSRHVATFYSILNVEAAATTSDTTSLIDVNSVSCLAFGKLKLKARGALPKPFRAVGGFCPPKQSHTILNGKAELPVRSALLSRIEGVLEKHSTRNIWDETENGQLQRSTLLETSHSCVLRPRSCMELADHEQISSGKTHV